MLHQLVCNFKLRRDLIDLSLQTGWVGDHDRVIKRQTVEALVELLSERCQLSTGFVNVAADLRQVFVLDGQGRVEHGQPLGVLDKQLKLGILLPQRFNLNETFVDLRRRLFPLTLKRKSKLVLRKKPLMKL